MADKSFEMRVKIEEICDTVQVTDSFKKREVICVTEGEHPQHFKFEFIQGKVDVPDSFIPGTYATISFNIRGRKVEPKMQGQDPMYFTTLAAWKMEA